MRVWVTRGEPSDGPLSTALHANGLEPVLEPVVEKRLVADPAALIAGLGPDDWLVLTSAYAIDAVVGDAARIPRVAVVGEKSKRLALTHGLRVELVSPDGHGATLFDELRRAATGGKVCYPRSSLAKVPENWPGAELRAPVLYETVTREFNRTVIDRVDVIAVASPSAVRAVGLMDLPFASIGRTTSAAIRELGREPWIEASEPNFEALATAIAAQDNPSDSRHHLA